MAAARVIVAGAGSLIANGVFTLRDAAVVPAAFALVCKASGWAAPETWAQLNGPRAWYESENSSYIYFNRGDRQWWLDSGVTGLGLYVSRAKGATASAPPRDGWELIGDGALPLPSVVASDTDGGEL